MQQNESIAHLLKGPWLLLHLFLSPPAQRREVPATLLQFEPKPLSAYDDNPILNEDGAAFIVGVTADCLKKWRQRNKGPDYIQYGKNGPVRYELNALLEFRDKHRITPRNGNKVSVR